MQTYIQHRPKRGFSISSIEDMLSLDNGVDIEGRTVLHMWKIEAMESTTEALPEKMSRGSSPKPMPVHPNEQ